MRASVTAKAFPRRFAGFDWLEKIIKGRDGANIAHI
jgi:hypothetical protein